MTNVSKVRQAARAAQLGPEDVAGVEWAVQLATLLDKARPRTLTQIANGEVDLELGSVLEVVKIIGPQYLRTLTAVGLTRAGRAVSSSNAPTAGSPQGVSADTAAHDQHRKRFSERSAG